MTGVEKIKERILLEAEKKASEIIENAKAQSEEIIKKAKKEAEIKAAEIAKKSNHDANEKKKISNMIIELEMRKSILSAKQQVIEKVFDTSLERLSNLEKNEYSSIMYNMLINAVETGDEEIILSKEDKLRSDEAFFQKLNTELKNRGKKGLIKVSQESRNIIGGFILRREGMELNNSFEAILKMQRDDIEPEVAQLLF